MKTLIQILFSAVLITLPVFNSSAQDSSTVYAINGSSFRIGDSCKVTMIDNREIYGVLVSRDVSTLQLRRNNTTYSVPEENISEIEHESNFPVYVSGQEPVVVPSYDYNIYLKKKSIVKCAPLEITGDSLLLSDGLSEKKVCVNDIRKMVRVNKSHFLKGLLIGAASVGLAAFVLLEVGIQDVDGSQRQQNPLMWLFPSGNLKAALVAEGTALGILSGAAIGGIIGAIMSKDDEYSLSKMDKERKIRELRKIIREK